MGFAAITIDTPFRNRYLSVSRLKQYEKCPLAFKLGYITKVETNEDKAAADLGKVVHEVLELIFKWIDAEEFTGKVPDEIILRHYRDAFQKAEGHVVGTDVYKEGLGLVRDYFRVHQEVSYLGVIATEQSFMLDIESDDGETRFEVNGIIDRVDRTGPTSIRIIDYKTNRFMFTREELDTDLQMSVYGLTAKALWPWATEIEFGFDMLRHKTRQRARRTDEQLNMAADYMIALGRRIESTLEFPPKLNPLCPWCEYREHCSEYDKAVNKGETTLSYMIATDDMERVSAERERACALERIAKKRRQEMDRILIARANHLNLDVLSIGEMRYKPTQSSDVDYPFHKTVAILAEALGLPESEIMARVSRVTKGRMDELISESNLIRGKRQLLRAKLETVAERTYGAAWVKATQIVERRG